LAQVGLKTHTPEIMAHIQKALSQGVKRLISTPTIRTTKVTEFKVEEDAADSATESEVNSPSDKATYALRRLSASTDMDDDICRIRSIDSMSTEIDDLAKSLPDFDDASSLERQSSENSNSSFCSSFARYAQPEQTLLFFDWDDTLFPTTEFFARMKLPYKGFEDERKVGMQLRTDMQSWRNALYMYLQEASRLSSQCVIVTNSRRPWVTDCIDAYVPEVKQFFGEGGIKIAYAMEHVKTTKTFKSQCMDLRPVLHRQVSMPMTPEEHQDEQTMAKYRAMKQATEAFYSSYLGQSWKNIISIGDMPFERDAVHEVCFKRNPIRKECLRTKAIILPTAPSLTEITLRLRFSRVMLPAYVHFDGDFDLDLSCADDPLQAIADALHMPQLAAVPFSRHAWGRVPLQQKDREVSEALADLAYTVHESVLP